jgi:hypothetical protein
VDLEPGFIGGEVGGGAVVFTGGDWSVERSACMLIAVRRGTWKAGRERWWWGRAEVVRNEGNERG